MNCALWLNRRKIYRASEIPENLDIASLRGYFLAGSLIDWLCANGGEEYAEGLSELSPDDAELNRKLAEVFKGEPLPVKALGLECNAPSVTAAQSALPTSSGLSSYPLSSLLGSVGGSRQPGSFETGSYSHRARLFALLARGYGSFSFGSFGSLFVKLWGDFFGSFSPTAFFPALPELDEYDRIMLETLMICPLDRFGYGIHNI